MRIDSFSCCSMFNYACYLCFGTDEEDDRLYEYVLKHQILGCQFISSPLTYSGPLDSAATRPACKFELRVNKSTVEL